MITEPVGIGVKEYQIFCWADNWMLPDKNCNKVMQTDIGLCYEHYKNIIGRNA